MKLYAHPFSSFCQKVLIAFYENDIAFDYRSLEDAQASAELAALWPLRRFPTLADGQTTVLESSSIIEYLQAHRPGPVRLIPDDPTVAVEVRMMDRVFDHYVSAMQARIVINAIRPENDRDPYGDAEARRMLETIYAWLDQRMTGREWTTEYGFSLADCAAAPGLFYADWTHPIPERFAALKAYRGRLLARPSFARCVDEARPYRPYFPLGAPDRD